jgi:nucleotide-binding universal stress UspA family protein
MRPLPDSDDLRARRRFQKRRKTGADHTQGTIVCGVTDHAERRVAVGDAPSLLGQIAAEEAADLIVVGARTRGRRRRGLESRLAHELETETPVPVLIAPPRLRQARKTMAINGARR